MRVLAEELGKLTGVVGEDELQRARAQLKVGLVSSLESSGARIEQIGRQMLLFGRPLDIDEVLAAVDRVDAAAVRRVAEQVMRKAKPTLAALGPIGQLESYHRFAARFGCPLAAGGRRHVAVPALPFRPAARHARCSLLS